MKFIIKTQGVVVFMCLFLSTSLFAQEEDSYVDLIKNLREQNRILLEDLEKKKKDNIQILKENISYIGKVKNVEEAIAADYSNMIEEMQKKNHTLLREKR